MSSEIDKELNGDSMLMHKSRHIHCDLVETLTVDGENGPRFQNESLEGYKVHDWNMNETAINEEDYKMNTNPTSDKKVTQIGSFRTGSAQSAEILIMIDTSDGFIHDNPTIIEDVANERQNMMQQPIASGISDDHLEEHQIYSNIVVDIRKQYDIQISYDKAWRAKELALGSIRGSPEESYITLPSYCYVLEQKNPGTITDIVTDCDNQFKYFFMSIGASLAGFHTSIRPMVAVDGTFLKAKYLGTLFIAACKDGNNQIYPLAFGIDRHGSIEKTVHKIFPHERHGVCTYHVGQNLKTKFKNPAIHKLFHDAAYAYRVSEFNFIFGQLEMIDPRAARYLMDIGVDRWARSYSAGKRYNIMTTGIVESLNAMLKNARDLPVLQLVEELRNLLQKWFVTRQQQAMSMSTELTMLADGELRSRYNMSATYLVEPINSKECNVNYAGISAQVNLDTRSCTCRQFDLDHIPCAHAIAACRFYNISCYTLCSKYFTTKALLSSYPDCIYPTGNEINWVVPNHIRDKVVLPPKTRRPIGRPRKVRIPFGGEGKRTSRCS
ncbi:hypothetical protein CK203_036885 [Vitis vinifera]|uniref:SWIM-type domain-containing protein n=1 Tax=Vitis vinifera TaxID=29760 RepID=A0A438GXQ8_VITVI|nr:hypothetical protein CK203_036885 [Vitis vinifera]